VVQTAARLGWDLNGLIGMVWFGTLWQLRHGVNRRGNERYGRARNGRAV